MTSGPRNSDFLTLVEQHTDAFVRNDDSAVEDVRKILADVRQQYDRVNSEAEKKASDLFQLRESIRVSDASNAKKADEIHRMEEIKQALEKQYDDTVAKIDDVQTCRKVYQHMLKRILHEQMMLKEKMLKMENHLEKKNHEAAMKVDHSRKANGEKVQSTIDLELMEQDADNERAVREDAMKAMMGTLHTKRNAIQRRADFERWRHEVALEAANEAFQGSAGRLRKLYAVEKLAGNCLQKITFDQVEKSQATEDGFQKIREVTGLTDVMDIVHKFLNRDVEHEQLKSSVKEAEARLEALREEFERFKKDTDSLAFDPHAAERSRSIYQEVEEHEATLNQALKDHEQSRQRLQRTTLSVENMKRWSNRMSKALLPFEEAGQTLVRVEKPAELPAYFRSLHRGIEKFTEHVQRQLDSGKIQKKTMSTAASKEYHEHARLLNDKDFLKSNCRVPASADGRPPSAREKQAGSEEDPNVQLQNERDKYKKESDSCVAEAAKKAELQKKKGGKA
jgi:hypothetical protein